MIMVMINKVRENSHESFLVTTYNTICIYTNNLEWSFNIYHLKEAPILGNLTVIL